MRQSQNIDQYKIIGYIDNMKKLFLIPILTILCLMGCDEKLYSVVITNDSEKNVTYTYNDTTNLLLAGEFTIHEVKAHTQWPKDFVDQNGIANIKIDQKGDGFTFTNAIAFNLNVMNTLPFDITIKAENYIENGISMVLLVTKNTENTDAKIYTKNPQITSISNYPVTYEYNFSVDTVYIILR